VTRPVSLTLDAPHFDPLQVAEALCPGGPGFLESPAPNPRTARFSLVPLRVRESYLLEASGLARLERGTRSPLSGDPLELLQEIWWQRRVAGELLFPGGFFGYLAYDLAGLIETLPRRARRDLPVPRLALAWVDVAAVYDHRDRRLTLASLDPEVALEPLAAQILALPAEPQPAPAPRASLQPELSPQQFCAMVERAKAYIAAGDIYQANLSCRFSGRYAGPSADLYRRLRAINPSPFAGLLRLGGVEIICGSPERLVSLHGDLAETRPIAGTRRRGRDPEEDRALQRELLAHPKERAEHIMLLDLERNDLGKVCATGSVEVDELMALEHYSHVSHIVSNVRGRLRPEVGPFDLLRAVFPGGTITGVPKKRCMEIIDELEPTGRGIYTGSAGYLSATGSMDFNILIRSFQRIGDQLSFQVGAGIVADSEPRREWQECLNKGEALQRALAT